MIKIWREFTDLKYSAIFKQFSFSILKNGTKFNPSMLTPHTFNVWIGNTFTKRTHKKLYKHSLDEMKHKTQ